MLRLTKPVFIGFLCFSRSLATKCVSLNNEPRMIGPTLTDLNPVGLNHYPFMVSLDKCSGSCNAFDDLSTKKCVLGKTKNVTVKVFIFNLITRINKAKTTIKHISCDCKCKFNSTCNSNQKWNNDTCQCECKKYRALKKIIVGIVVNVFVRIVRI